MSTPIESLLSGTKGGLLWFDDKYTHKVEFTESGIYTNTTDKVQTVVIGICGGGAGSGTAQPYTGGGGGSAMTYHKITLQPNETVVVTIGAGGLIGNDGGDSSFGTYVTAKGGKTPVGSAYEIGVGENGGTNGTAQAGSSNNPLPLTVSKVIDGVIVTKNILPHATRYSSNDGFGGCGGGYDYEGRGGGTDNAPTGYGAGACSSASPIGDGTDGICVLWYNGE